MACLLLVPQLTHALDVDHEVMPRVLLSGRIVSTVDAKYELEASKETAAINTDDSRILLGFDKKLYKDGVAGTSFGITEIDKEVKFHHLNTYFWNQNFRMEIGKGSLNNSIIEFPLIRDGDLLTYTHILNGSSDKEFDQLFAKNLKSDWYFDKKMQKIGFWLSSRENSDSHEAPGEFDSFGVSYAYQVPENLAYVRTLRQIGFLLERQKVIDDGKKEWLNIFVAGGEINLNKRSDKNWSLATQYIFNLGLAHAHSAITLSDQARAESTALVAALRYTARPHLLTRWQAALTTAYKTYHHVDNATQWSVIPTLFYRLGQGIDLLTQATYHHYSAGLNNGESEIHVQIGLVFNLDININDSVGERDSISNFKQGYVR